MAKGGGPAKGGGGGKNCCSSCSGRGFHNTSVQRVIEVNGKEKTVTENVRVDCVPCGGSGNA